MLGIKPGSATCQVNTYRCTIILAPFGSLFFTTTCLSAMVHDIVPRLVLNLEVDAFRSLPVTGQGLSKEL